MWNPAAAGAPPPPITNPPVQGAPGTQQYWPQWQAAVQYYNAATTDATSTNEGTGSGGGDPVVWMEKAAQWAKQKKEEEDALKQQQQQQLQQLLQQQQRLQQLQQQQQQMLEQQMQALTQPTPSPQQSQQQAIDPAPAVPPQQPSPHWTQHQHQSQQEQQPQQHQPQQHQPQQQQQQQQQQHQSILQTIMQQSSGHKQRSPPPTSQWTSHDTMGSHDPMRSHDAMRSHDVIDHGHTSWQDKYCDNVGGMDQYQRGHPPSREGGHFKSVADKYPTPAERPGLPEASRFESLQSGPPTRGRTGYQPRMQSGPRGGPPPPRGGWRGRGEDRFQPRDIHGQGARSRGPRPQYPPHRLGPPRGGHLRQQPSYFEDAQSEHHQDTYTEDEEVDQFRSNHPPMNRPNQPKPLLNPPDRASPRPLFDPPQNPKHSDYGVPQRNTDTPPQSTDPYYDEQRDTAVQAKSLLPFHDKHEQPTSTMAPTRQQQPFVHPLLKQKRVEEMTNEPSREAPPVKIESTSRTFVQPVVPKPAGAAAGADTIASHQDDQEEKMQAKTEPKTSFMPRQVRVNQPPIVKTESDDIESHLYQSFEVTYDEIKDVKHDFSASGWKPVISSSDGNTPVAHTTALKRQEETEIPGLELTSSRKSTAPETTGPGAVGNEWKQQSLQEDVPQVVNTVEVVSEPFPEATGQVPAVKMDKQDQQEMIVETKGQYSFSSRPSEQEQKRQPDAKQTESKDKPKVQQKKPRKITGKEFLLGRWERVEPNRPQQKKVDQPSKDLPPPDQEQSSLPLTRPAEHGDNKPPLTEKEVPPEKHLSSQRELVVDTPPQSVNDVPPDNGRIPEKDFPPGRRPPEWDYPHDRRPPEKDFPPDRRPPERDFPPDKRPPERDFPPDRRPPERNFPPDRRPPERDFPPDRRPPDRDFPPDRRPPDRDFPPDRRPPERDFPPNRRPPDRDFPPDRRPPERDFPPDRRPPDRDFPPDRRPPERDFPPDRRPPDRDFPPDRRFPGRDFPPDRRPPDRDFLPDRRPPERDFPPDRRPPGRDFPPDRRPPEREFPPDRRPPGRDFPPDRRPPEREFPPDRRPPDRDFYSDRLGRDFPPGRRPPDWDFPPDRRPPERDYFPDRRPDRGFPHDRMPPGRDFPQDRMPPPGRDFPQPPEIRFPPDHRPDFPPDQRPSDKDFPLHHRPPERNFPLDRRQGEFPPDRQLPPERDIPLDQRHPPERDIPPGQRHPPERDIPPDIRRPQESDFPADQRPPLDRGLVSDREVERERREYPTNKKHDAPVSAFDRLDYDQRDQPTDNIGKQRPPYREDPSDRPSDQQWPPVHAHEQGNRMPPRRLDQQWSPGRERDWPPSDRPPSDHGRRSPMQDWSQKGDWYGDIMRSRPEASYSTDIPLSHDANKSVGVTSSDTDTSVHEAVAQLAEQMKSVKGLASKLNLPNSPKTAKEWQEVAKMVAAAAVAGGGNSQLWLQKQQHEEGEDDTQKRVAAMLANDSDSDGENPGEVKRPSPAREFDGTYAIPPEFYRGGVGSDQHYSMDYGHGPHELRHRPSEDPYHHGDRPPYWDSREYERFPPGRPFHRPSSPRPHLPPDYKGIPPPHLRHPSDWYEGGRPRSPPYPQYGPPLPHDIPSSVLDEMTSDQQLLLANAVNSGGDSKKKGLPTWLKEGLEQLEREKQRKAEAEATKKKRKSRWSDATNDEDSSSQLSEVNSSLYESDEELQAALVATVRRLLTEILLSVTNSEISAIVRECMEEEETKFKFKIPALPKRALKPTSILGLGHYDSDSGSEDDNESNKDKGRWVPLPELPNKPAPGMSVKQIAEAFAASKAKEESAKKKKRSRWSSPEPNKKSRSSSSSKHSSSSKSKSKSRYKH